MSLIRSLAAAVALFAAGTALADVDTFAPDGVAINGYDPVAYHLVNMPVVGSEAFTAEWDGATWRFASAENRDAFLDQPERFAPAYGGFCAFGTSKGVKKATQPDEFRVVGGTLYLNSSPAAQSGFLTDQPGTISKADSNWDRIAPIPADRL